MSLATIRTALRAKVAGVTGISGIAPVYDYIRLVKSEQEIKDVMVGTGQNRLHYWWVSPAQTETLRIIQRMGCQDGVYRFEIHGFYALEDVPPSGAMPSEKAFLLVVEALHNALRTDMTLGGTVRMVEGEWPAVGEFDHRMMSSVLCHHARLSFAAKTQLA